MKRKMLITSIAILVGGMAFMGTASADIIADMSRIDADAGGGGVAANNVRNNCGGGSDGFDSASATLHSMQGGESTRVKIQIKNASPDTLFTVWIRQKGNDQDGNSFGGAPLTGGGATPLAPSSALAALVEDWIGPGSTSGANAFSSDAQGNGTLFVNLDFSLEGGHYPYNNISADALADIRTYKNAGALATPTAIVDPRQDGVSGPFLIRMVSHCLDGLGHGLSPAAREPWFQYP